MMTEKFTPPPLSLTLLPDSLSAGLKIYAVNLYSGATGSLKDFMVPYVLRRAKEQGELEQAQPIVEASSGNTGEALAYEGARLGHKVHIFTSANVSPEKIERIKSHGATVHQSAPGAPGQTEIFEAKEFAKSSGFYLFNQFENPYHLDAYREHLASPLHNLLCEKSIIPKTLICGVGSGASFRALGEMVRSINQDAKLFAVTPDSLPTEIEGLHPDHLSPIGAFPIWQKREQHFETETLRVSEIEALHATVKLWRAGFVVGPGSGACLSVAIKKATPGETLILPFCDSGMKYESRFSSWRQLHKQKHLKSYSF